MIKRNYIISHLLPNSFLVIAPASTLILLMSLLVGGDANKHISVIEIKSRSSIAWYKYIHCLMFRRACTSRGILGHKDSTFSLRSQTGDNL
jgi:hypothetical protein